MLLAASGVRLENRGQWVGEEVVRLEAVLDPPTSPGKEPRLTLTVARPGFEVGENMLGEGRPLTFPSASESLELLLLLLLLESEEPPGPC